MLSTKEILIYFSIIANGEWFTMMRMLNRKTELPSDEIVLEAINNIHSKVITIYDEEYPCELKASYMPPLVLYYKGDISLLKRYADSCAFIGTRNPTEYGTNITRKIIEEMPNNYVIVSGLAKGIDAISHEAALRSNKKTIAVIGSGINYCYPEENTELYDEIAKNGLVISEYPDMTIPKPIYFPYRNRIIAYLSKLVVVTEAASKSGTSITVGFALQGNTNVCAVPYLAGTDSLCNILLREGAALVENADDIVYEMSDTKFRKKIFEY